MTIPKKFKPQAIIFDKDGTLIDFDAMWGGWTSHLADQLKQASGLNVHKALCNAFGVDESSNKVLAGGKLASMPMSLLYNVTVDVMCACGLDNATAKDVVENVWCIPDPVILAKPVTDLRKLFGDLSELGIKIAIATADDRAPTQAMVDAFDIGEFISCMACADDGIPSKPAPHMALTLCKQMNIAPGNVMVIGDTLSDLMMARSAGAGLAVGVLSGVSSAKNLVQSADYLLDSVDDLHEFVLALNQNELHQTNTKLKPDFAF